MGNNGTPANDGGAGNTVVAALVYNGAQQILLVLEGLGFKLSGTELRYQGKTFEVVVHPLPQVEIPKLWLPSLRPGP